jgi:hypothetical protein
MNTIGNISTLPVLPAAPKASAPSPDTALLVKEALPGNTQPTEIVDVKLAAQQQVAKVPSSEPIANSRVLGTTTFITFKDASGQAVTRFRDVTTGKVSYFPRDPEFSRVDIRA